MLQNTLKCVHLCRYQSVCKIEAAEVRRHLLLNTRVAFFSSLAGLVRDYTRISKIRHKICGMEPKVTQNTMQDTHAQICLHTLDKADLEPRVSGRAHSQPLLGQPKPFQISSLLPPWAPWPALAPGKTKNKPQKSLPNLHLGL